MVSRMEKPSDFFIRDICMYILYIHVQYNILKSNSDSVLFSLYKELRQFHARCVRTMSRTSTPNLDSSHLN